MLRHYALWRLWCDVASGHQMRLIPEFARKQSTLLAGGQWLPCWFPSTGHHCVRKEWVLPTVRTALPMLTGCWANARALAQHPGSIVWYRGIAGMVDCARRNSTGLKAGRIKWSRAYNAVLSPHPYCALSLPGVVFSCKLRYIVGFGLVEMVISTNPKPTIYRNLHGP